VEAPKTELVILPLSGESQQHARGHSGTLAQASLRLGPAEGFAYALVATE